MLVQLSFTFTIIIGRSCIINTLLNRTNFSFNDCDLSLLIQIVSPCKSATRVNSGPYSTP